MEKEEEQTQKLHKILNEYISKNHKLNVRILGKRLSKMFNRYIDEDIIEELLEDIYMYMFTNMEKTFEFYETGHLQRLVNSLMYNTLATYNTSKKLFKRGDISYVEDVLPEYEDIEEQEEYTRYTVEDLNWTLPNEERLEYHQMALDELKEYLFENPHCNLAKALEIQKKKGDKAYATAIHFAATPSYKFLRDNYKLFGLTNPQFYVDDFKKTLAQITGKPLIKHSQAPCIL